MGGYQAKAFPGMHLGALPPTPAHTAVGILIVLGPGSHSTPQGWPPGPAPGAPGLHSTSRTHQLSPGFRLYSPSLFLKRGRETHPHLKGQLQCHLPKHVIPDHATRMLHRAGLHDHPCPASSTWSKARHTMITWRGSAEWAPHSLRLSLHNQHLMHLHC